MLDTSLTRYTVFIDGKKSVSSLYEPFSEDSLHQAEQLILKEASYGVDEREGSAEKGHLFRKCLLKVLKFLFKFQQFLLKKVLLGGEPSTPVHIISLCVQYNAKPSADEPCHLANSDFLKVVYKADNDTSINGEKVAEERH